MYTAQRYHDISCGHRVMGHESKCANLHGHNYRIHFICAAKIEHYTDADSAIRVHGKLDRVGRVIDFSVIKEKLCMWLENNWDHKFLIFYRDPFADLLQAIDSTIVKVSFNPTAENMAQYLAAIIGPAVLENTGVEVIRVIVEETRKCSATFEVDR